MIKRSYARAYIAISSVAFGLFIIISFRHRGSALWELLLWTDCGLWGVSFIIKLKYLRCPYCKKLTVEPQWSKNGTRKCSNCGKVFEYDK